MDHDVFLQLVCSCMSVMRQHVTRRAGLRALFRVFQEHVSLDALTLGWEEVGQCVEWRAVSLQDKVTLHSSEVKQRPWQALLGEDEFGLFPDPQGLWRVVLLLERGESPSWISLLLDKQRDAEALFSPPTLRLWQECFRMWFRQTELLSRVAEVSRKAHQHNKQLRRELEGYVHWGEWSVRSPAMQVVLQQAEAVARYDTTVLIQGESGVGKERLARFVHERSRRSQGLFLKVNCGAWPESLLDSELFGHEKGAFTGAERRHRGCFERADGGTLLLDEVAELPLSAQVKLLRVLQEGALERVGGEETLHVNVRVLAATHQPLEQWVAEGKFRADLFYRLHVFPLFLPPLRERLEDLPALVHEILVNKAQQLGRSVPSLSAETMQQLEAMPWSGNVRELENTLERALILSPGKTLKLPERSMLWEPKSPSLDAAPREEPTLRTWEEAVRDCILQALQASRGVLYGENGAAAKLGLKPSTLQSKMKKLGISRHDGVSAQR